MAIIYGNFDPGAGNVGVDGDIFVRNTLVDGTWRQWRYSSQAPAPHWVPIVPPVAGSPRDVLSDTRADTVPPRVGEVPTGADVATQNAARGIINDRLAKIGANAWQVGWRNAASGIVTDATAATFSYTVPALEWTVTHNLGFRAVDVTVLSPGATNWGTPTPEPQMIIYPAIMFTNPNSLVLTFARPVAGTVIVRR